MKVEQTNNNDYENEEAKMESDDLTFNKIYMSGNGKMENKGNNYDKNLINNSLDNDLLFKQKDHFYEYSNTSNYLSNNYGMPEIPKRSNVEHKNPFMFDESYGKSYDSVNPISSKREPTYYSQDERDYRRFGYMNASGKTRTRTTTEQLAILEQVCKTTVRPNKETRVRLAKELGMNQRQVQIWFQNKRAKLKKGSLDEIYYTGKEDKYNPNKNVNNPSYNQTSDIFNPPSKFTFSKDFSQKQAYNDSYNYYGNQKPYLLQPSYQNYYDYANNNSFTTTYLRNYCGLPPQKSIHDDSDITHYYSNKGPENPNRASYSEYVNLYPFDQKKDDKSNVRNKYYIRQDDYEYEQKDKNTNSYDEN